MQLSALLPAAFAAHVHPSDRSKNDLELIRRRQREQWCHEREGRPRTSRYIATMQSNKVRIYLAQSRGTRTRS
jgi:hypothetical protein